jgi:hypothetical protein
MTTEFARKRHALKVAKDRKRVADNRAMNKAKSIAGQRMTAQRSSK